jgi:enoyl-CoA hydratase/carnithine racemase
MKIVTEKNERVLKIILNNPEKMNCMGIEMLKQLDEAVAAAATDDSISCLIIEGAGERTFSTGADLKEFQKLTEAEETTWIEFGNEVLNKIEELPKPTLAFIRGYVMGGGLELALACDFRIAAENSVFASPELQHGWLPGWGGMTRLRRVAGEARAKEMVMLNRRYTAQQAYRMGLVTEVVEADKMEGVLSEYSEQLSALKLTAFKLAKAALQDPSRTTKGSDIQFDVLAMQIAKKQSK